MGYSPSNGSPPKVGATNEIRQCLIKFLYRFPEQFSLGLVICYLLVLKCIQRFLKGCLNEFTQNSRKILSFFQSKIPAWMFPGIATWTHWEIIVRNFTWIPRPQVTPVVSSRVFSSLSSWDWVYHWLLNGFICRWAVCEK